MHKPGIGKSVDKTTWRPLPQAKIGNAASLLELTHEFTAFSLGLLCTQMPLESHPYEDFCHETGRSGILAPLRFGHQLFRGLQGPRKDSSWEQGLFLLAIEDWEVFRPWLASLVVLDSSRGLTARVRLQQVAIYDPIVVARKQRHLADEHPPIVDVWATALEQPNGCWYFNKDLPPRAIFDEAMRFSDTLNFGGASLPSSELDHDQNR